MNTRVRFPTRNFYVGRLEDSPHLVLVGDNKKASSFNYLRIPSDVRFFLLVTATVGTCWYQLKLFQDVRLQGIWADP